MTAALPRIGYIHAVLPAGAVAIVTTTGHLVVVEQDGSIGADDIGAVAVLLSDGRVSLESEQSTGSVIP